MGKGGPMAFLNKKPWHPGSGRNQEDIWKREQAFMKEVEKREELKKQIEEQREQEGFDDFVAEATKQQRDERVEWMYQGGFAAQEDAGKRKEEYLLGKAVDRLPDNGKEEPKSRHPTEAGSVQVDELTSGGGATHSGIDFSTNETWNRLNADPLLLIKRNEVSKVKAVTSNPYLVAQLKERLRAERSAKANKKHKKKEKASKEKKHKRRRRSRSPSASPASPPRQRSITGQPTEGPSGPSRVLHDGPAAGAHGGHSRRNMDDGAGRHHEAHPSHHSCRDAADHSSRDPAASRHSGRDADDGGHQRRREYTDEQATPAAQGSPHRHSRDDASGAERAGGVGQGAHRGRGEDREHKRSRRAEHVSTRLRDDAPQRAGTPGNTNQHSPSRGERGALRYGLQTGHVPEHVASVHESRSELTRTALAERGRRKREEAEEVRARAAAARRSYRPGQMSSEEVDARRREMEGNADELERSRVHLLRQSHKEDKEEARAAAKGRQPDTEEFVTTQQQKMMASSDVGTLEGQLRRNRAHLSR